MPSFAQYGAAPHGRRARSCSCPCKATITAQGSPWPAPSGSGRGARPSKLMKASGSSRGPANAAPGRPAALDERRAARRGERCGERCGERKGARAVRGGWSPAAHAAPHERGGGRYFGWRLRRMRLGARASVMVRAPASDCRARSRAGGRRSGCWWSAAAGCVRCRTAAWPEPRAREERRRPSSARRNSARQRCWPPPPRPGRSKR